MPSDASVYMRVDLNQHFSLTPLRLACAQPLISLVGEGVFTSKGLHLGRRVRKVEGLGVARTHTLTLSLLSAFNQRRPKLPMCWYRFRTEHHSRLSIFPWTLPQKNRVVPCARVLRQNEGAVLDASTKARFCAARHACSASIEI